MSRSKRPTDVLKTCGLHAALLLSLAVAPGCRTRSSEEASPRESAAASASPSPEARAPAAPWALVYERRCYGGWDAPALASTRVSACGGFFEAEDGRFLERAPEHLIAVLPGGGGMIAAEGSRSLVYLPGQGAEIAARTELQEGFNYGDLRNDFVLSSSGERLARASWETVDIYQIPSLDHLRTIRLGSEARGRRIVFFDGEAIMLFAKYPCEPIPNAPYPNCRSSALLVLNPGADKFEPSASFLDLEAVAIDKAGASAAIVRSDSTAAVLSVPMGQVIAELPRQTGCGTSLSARAAIGSPSRIRKRSPFLRYSRGAPPRSCARRGS